LEVNQVKVRKFLSRKISQLNDIVADLDGLVTQIGFEFYRVCIFGSARIKAESQDYKTAYDLAFALASRGVDIVTGGGPGLMEAANHGAKDGSKQKSRSIGVPIQLPHESGANSHLDVKYNHRRFSSRLDEFMRISHAIVVTPGGIGTVLELMYTWQLLQVKHMESKPLILLGNDMWSGFIDWLREQPLKRNLMDEADFKNLMVVGSVDEVVKFLEPCIKTFYEQKKK